MSDQRKAKEEQAKCPKCESDLHLVDQVGQHYCFSCETYFAPEDLSKKEEKKGETKEEAPACAPPEPAKKEEPARREEPVAKEEPKAELVAQPEPPKEEPEPEKPVEASMPEVPKPEPPEAPAGDAKAQTAEDILLEAVEGEESAPAEEELKRCTSCEGELTYVPKYDRWYCYTCRRYEPKEAPKVRRVTSARKCVYCGAEAELIEKYDRYYCRSCKKYLPKEGTERPMAEAPGVPICAQCGRPTTWIQNYERYYCYPCKKYAPKMEMKREAKAVAAQVRAASARPSAPACAYCGKPTTYVAKYERYYCYPCQKYVSKVEPKLESKPGAQPRPAPICAQCGKPTAYIAKYERYYCYPCRKYAAK